MQTQKWYQSWGLWLSMAALLVLMVKDIFGVDISASVDKYMTVLLSILVGFGVINNPNTRGALGYMQQRVIDLKADKKEGDGNADE